MINVTCKKMSRLLFSQSDLWSLSIVKHYLFFFFFFWTDCRWGIGLIQLKIRGIWVSWNRFQKMHFVYCLPDRSSKKNRSFFSSFFSRMTNIDTNRLFLSKPYVAKFTQKWEQLWLKWLSVVGNLIMCNVIVFTAHSLEHHH